MGIPLDAGLGQLLLQLAVPSVQLGYRGVDLVQLHDQPIPPLLELAHLGVQAGQHGGLIICNLSHHL